MILFTFKDTPDTFFDMWDVKLKKKKKTRIKIILCWVW